MEPNGTPQDARAQVARQLGMMLRRHARRRWTSVRTAERDARGHHVWRFRAGADAGDRYLHVAHEAMEQAENPSRLLFDQLRAGRWLDRLDDGAERSLRLSATGEVEAYPGRHLH